MAPTSIQRGIADPAPEHVCVAALTFNPGQQANAVLANLAELVRREYGADIDAIDRETPTGAVTPDAGELGVDTGYDTTNLTITLGISASGFAALGMAATQPAASSPSTGPSCPTSRRIPIPVISCCRSAPKRLPGRARPAPDRADHDRPADHPLDSYR